MKRASPHWDFGDPEVKMIRLLRDWPNGHTASRPRSWVLIYGQHPEWMRSLREDGIKVAGMWKHKVPWKGYVVGTPLDTPFLYSQFQIYIYDDFPYQPFRLALEISRVVATHGFFLYRYTKNGEFAKHLQELGWERFDWDFREFMIWWRNAGLRREDGSA